MKRDRVALERRRMQAARLLDQGHSEAEVARQLGGPSLSCFGRRALRRMRRRPKLVRSFWKQARLSL
jgi:hypothetical protein